MRAVRRDVVLPRDAGDARVEFVGGRGELGEHEQDPARQSRPQADAVAPSGSAPENETAARRLAHVGGAQCRAARRRAAARRPWGRWRRMEAEWSWGHAPKLARRGGRSRCGTRREPRRTALPAVLESARLRSVTGPSTGRHPGEPRAVHVHRLHGLPRLGVVVYYALPGIRFARWWLLRREPRLLLPALSALDPRAARGHRDRVRGRPGDGATRRAVTSPGQAAAAHVRAAGHRRGPRDPLRLQVHGRSPRRSPNRGLALAGAGDLRPGAVARCCRSASRSGRS